MILLHRRQALLASIAACALLSSCADPRIARQPVPPLFRDLARFGQAVDLPTAASVFSGYRNNSGLSAVEVDPRLVEVAREMAQLMAERDSVEASLTQPAVAERLTRKGVKVTAAGENVSAGFHTLAEAFSGWRGSPHHDRVLKLPGATHFGIAAAYSPRSKFRVFWALVMAHG